MPLGINVFSFGLFGALFGEKTSPSDVERDRGAGSRPATETRQRDIRDNEKSLEHQAIFQSGFFPIY
ncbi:MAG TPA: hypothetical protein DIC56_09155 [Rhizobium sp.]|nr:hypothetical protein [Rhizobium sp.]